MPLKPNESYFMCTLYIEIISVIARMETILNTLILLEEM